MHDILEDWPLWNLCSEKPQPKHISPLPDGFNNHCFLLNLDSGSYVLRLEGKNSQALNIDREVEFQLHQFLAEQGLAPTIRYRSLSKQYWIRDFVAGHALNANALHGEHLMLMMRKLQHIHTLPVPTGLPEISISHKAEYFWNIIASKTQSADLLQLKAVCQNAFAGTPSASVCLCHMDPVPANWVETTNGELVLLDWEYAGLAHPYWDFVTLLQQTDAPTERAILQEFGIKHDAAWHFAKRQIQYLSAIWYRAQDLLSDQDLIRELRAVLA